MNELEVASFLAGVDEAWRPPLTETQRTVWASLVQPYQPQIAFDLLKRLARTERARPWPIDFAADYKRALADTLPLQPPQPEARDEQPAWVAGWAAARRAGDYRLWPEQELGYRQLAPDYNWERDVAERGLMPLDARLEWMRAGSVRADSDSNGAIPHWKPSVD